MAQEHGLERPEPNRTRIGSHAYVKRLATKTSHPIRVVAVARLSVPAPFLTSTITLGRLMFETTVLQTILASVALNRLGALHKRYTENGQDRIMATTPTLSSKLPEMKELSTPLTAYARIPASASHVRTLCLCRTNTPMPGTSATTRMPCPVSPKPSGKTVPSETPEPALVRSPTLPTRRKPTREKPSRPRLMTRMPRTKTKKVQTPRCVGLSSAA